MCRKFVAFFMGRNRMCLWHAWFVATSLGLGRCSMRTLTQLNHNHSHKHNMPGIQAANMLRIRCVIMWAIEMISCTLLLYFDLTTDTPHGLICVMWMWMWRVRSEQISQQFVADDSCVLLLDITILTWRKNAPDIYLIHPAICICRPLNAKCRLLWRLQCSALFVIFSSRAVMLQHERNSLRWMATGVCGTYHFVGLHTLWPELYPAVQPTQWPSRTTPASANRQPLRFEFAGRRYCHHL